MVVIRYNTDYRPGGIFLQVVQPRLKQGNIAPEFIDDKTLDIIFLRLIQQGKSADQRGEYASPVYIADQ